MKKITGYKTLPAKHFKNTVEDETAKSILEFNQIWNSIKPCKSIDDLLDTLDFVIHYPPEDTPQQEAYAIIRSEIIRLCTSAKATIDGVRFQQELLAHILSEPDSQEAQLLDDEIIPTLPKLSDFYEDVINELNRRVVAKVKEAIAVKKNGNYLDKEFELAISPFFAGADELPVEAIDKEAHRLAQHRYANIRQGIATNTLTKIRPTKRNTKIDQITGTATIKKGVFTLTISNYKDIADFRTSTYQLLDALTEELTASGAKEPVVTLSLAAYMEKRGLSDRKEARKQVEADLDLLYNASISFKEKRRGQEADFLDVRICDAKGISRGIINFSFGSTFYNILKGYPIMPVVPKLYQINSNRNRYSYALLRRMMEHKNMNAGKKNENIISVKKLLEACENMPRYEDVMASDRRVRARIIDPFERDLDELADTLSWHYCHSNNEPLTDEELEAVDYDLFTTLLIHFDFYEWPDQTERLQRKAERTEAAKRKSSSGRKKAAQA